MDDNGVHNIQFGINFIYKDYFEEKLFLKKDKSI